MRSRHLTSRGLAVGPQATGRVVGCLAGPASRRPPRIQPASNFRRGGNTPRPGSRRSLHVGKSAEADGGPPPAVGDRPSAMLSVGRSCRHHAGRERSTPVPTLAAVGRRGRLAPALSHRSGAPPVPTAVSCSGPSRQDGGRTAACAVGDSVKPAPRRSPAAEPARNFHPDDWAWGSAFPTRRPLLRCRTPAVGLANHRLRCPCFPHADSASLTGCPGGTA